MDHWMALPHTDSTSSSVSLPDQAAGEAQCCRGEARRHDRSPRLQTLADVITSFIYSVYDRRPDEEKRTATWFLITMITSFLQAVM
ncbi:uncharacterized [Tachysurus ichikawai]